MGRFIGSQYRETLRESGYRLFERPEPGIAILEDEDGKRELWFVNDHSAGYVVQIGRWGYEFTRSVPLTARRNHVTTDMR